ncbi:hypothetical protein FACS189456_7250 [Bacteroidia bacterium]|nr:hypothetical protein FACS189456_7250 [Bacteroidia bacterium]
MVSLYDFCCTAGYGFKLFFVSPLPLSSFLIPNKYDWQIAQEDLCYDSKSATAFLISHHKFAERYLSHVAKRQKEQIHIYTNAELCGTRFGQRFNELFKYSSSLEKEMQRNRETIGGDYVSVSFRFMRLLGDFEDAVASIVLPDKKRSELISRSLQQIEKIHTENNGSKVLVTSDSALFLKLVKVNFDYAYTTSGAESIVHLDVNDSDIHTHMKTFVDFFMVSEAKKIYQARSPQMYKSAFAWTASRVNNTPFIEWCY